MSQPRRVQFINGVPFPIAEDAPTSDRPASFDGGVRGEYHPPAPKPHERREGAWITVEYEDGARLDVAGARPMSGDEEGTRSGKRAAAQ